MGMDRNSQATFVVTPLNTPVKVTGQVARTGFPSTVIVNNGLVMNGNITATVNFKQDLNNNFGLRTVYLYINGVQVASAGDAAAGTYGPVNFINGDRIEVFASASTTAGQQIAGTSANYCYLS